MEELGLQLGIHQERLTFSLQGGLASIKTEDNGTNINTRTRLIDEEKYTVDVNDNNTHLKAIASTNGTTETPEQRDARLKRNRGYYAKKMNNLGEDGRKATNKAVYERTRKRLAKETDEERLARYAKQKVVRDKKLANETSDQRAKRLERMRTGQRKRIANETLEQRQLRLQRANELQSARKSSDQVRPRKRGPNKNSKSNILREKMRRSTSEIVEEQPTPETLEERSTSASFEALEELSASASFEAVKEQPTGLRQNEQNTECQIALDSSNRSMDDRLCMEHTSSTEKVLQKSTLSSHEVLIERVFNCMDNHRLADIAD